MTPTRPTPKRTPAKPTPTAPPKPNCYLFNSIRDRPVRARDTFMSKSTKNLGQLRIEIDTVDRELLGLLNRRATLAGEVGEIKRAEGSAVFRPEREAQVINTLQGLNPGPLLQANVATIWREIMSAC